MNTTKQGQGADLNNLFEDFFGGNPRKSGTGIFPTTTIKNYKVEQKSDDGSNVIFINATGYGKADITIEVINGELLITAPKLTDSVMPFIPTIDYKFDLGDTFDENGIDAFCENGILTINVKRKPIKTQVKKVIQIT